MLEKVHSPKAHLPWLTDTTGSEDAGKRAMTDIWAPQA